MLHSHIGLGMSPNVHPDGDRHESGQGKQKQNAPPLLKQQRAVKSPQIQYKQEEDHRNHAAGGVGIEGASQKDAGQDEVHPPPLVVRWVFQSCPEKIGSGSGHRRQTGSPQSHSTHENRPEGDSQSGTCEKGHAIAKDSPRQQVGEEDCGQTTQHSSQTNAQIIVAEKGDGASHQVDKQRLVACVGFKIDAVSAMQHGTGIVAVEDLVVLEAWRHRFQPIKPKERCYQQNHR